MAKTSVVDGRCGDGNKEKSRIMPKSPTMMITTIVMKTIAKERYAVYIHFVALKWDK